MDQPSEFLTRTLTSGVQVVAQPMAGVQSAAVGIFIGTGARDETPKNAGISHLTESMMFRGTEHLSSRDLTDQFDRLGVARDSNAGLEITLFSGVMLGGRLPAALDLFADVLRYPSFPADDLESVRALQLQEIAQREDQPPRLVMDRLRRLYYARTPLSHDVLGLPETVQALTRDDLHGYWQERYTANNVLISIAGRFEWDPLLDQLERLTADWPTGSGRMLMHEPPINAAEWIESRPGAQENIGFAFPAVPYGDAHYYEAALAAIILGGSMNSRLFIEVREKRGLAYSVSARFEGIEKTGFVRIYAGTQPQRAHETVSVIRSELAKLQDHGIDEHELTLAQARLKSQLVMGSESTVTRAMGNGRRWWYTGQLRTLAEIRDAIDHVTVESTSAFLRELGITQNLAFVAVGPLDRATLSGEASPSAVST